jgi:hypothetical protein
VLVALLAAQNQRPVQTAATRQSLQLFLQAVVVAVVRRLEQLDRQVVRVGAKAATYPVLVLVQQIKVTGVELLALAEQILTLAVAVALEQWGVLTLLGLLLALVGRVFLQASQVLL